MSQNESAAMAGPQGPCYLSGVWSQWLHHACPSSKFISDLLLKKKAQIIVDSSESCRRRYSQSKHYLLWPLVTYHIQQGCQIVIYLVVFQECFFFVTCGGYIWFPSSYRSMRQQLRRPEASRFRTWMIQSIGGKAKKKHPNSRNGHRHHRPSQWVMWLSLPPLMCQFVAL